MNKTFKNVLSISLATVATAVSLGTTANASSYYWGGNYGGYGGYGNYGYYSPYVQSSISLDSAKSIALKHAGVDANNAMFTKAGMDYEDDYWCYVYEIEFLSNGVEYEYEIKAADGKILKSERENKWNYGDWGGQQQQQQVSYGVTAEQAKQIALQRAGLQGANVWDLKVKSKYKRGISLWEVSFDYYGWEYEVKVDSSGNVVDYDVERD